jgi:hypothetical protein
MPMFDYTLQDRGVTVRTGSMWLDETPQPGRIEFSTGDQWWRLTKITAPADPNASGQIVCVAVAPGAPDSSG